MAAALTPTLIDKDFRNWLKGALAALFARQGLVDFVEKEVTDFLNDLLNDVWNNNGIPAGTTCGSCTTANVLVCPDIDFCSKGRKCNIHNPNISSSKPNQPCPRRVCTAMRDAIRDAHRYRRPSWKNTDTRGWCTDVYQIAKCYMPPDGYSNKVSFAETDYNGVIAVILNNKKFEKIMPTSFSNKICEQAREAGREIRHSATHQLSDKDLVSHIDVYIQLLSDPMYLATDAKAKDAVEKLKQLKTNSLTIHADDITTVLNDNIKTTFDDRQKALIDEIQNHFKIYKTDSIEVIDKKIQEYVEESLEKIKEEAEKVIEKGKKVLTVQAKEEKEELSEHIRKGKIELSAQVYQMNTKTGAEKKNCLTELWDKLTFKEFRLRSRLKEDLINYYRTNESHIPAAPLVEEHNVALEDLYVLPPMCAYASPYQFGPGNDTQPTPVNNVKERQEITINKLFLSDDKNVRYKKIYITANAGFGKTSLSQKLTMTWCQCHQPLMSLESKYEVDELTAMKYFDYLFLLHLRDYRSEFRLGQEEPTCNLDDLIMRCCSRACLVAHSTIKSSYKEF